MSTHSQDATLPQEGVPWLEPWPTDQLEVLGQCPVCGSNSREILHADLVDNTFFCAPGIWKMFSCKTCFSAYLDPRPTPLSIGLAYTRYYTHDQGDEKFDYVNLGLVRRIRRQLVNGYTNWRFGTKAEPSHPLGILAAFLVPGMRAQLATEYRNLPKKSPKGSKVLDIGCGDAAFLELARNCGWEVVGVDPDPRAVVVAQARGLDVRQGGVEIFNEQAEVFDIITLNNVVEHLHDPGAVLGACHRLLKPGGHIWLDTPNIDSPGHRFFGANWRGLETPRHLVLFNHTSLVRLLMNAGFQKLKIMPHRNVYQGMFRMSQSMRTCYAPESYQPLPFTLRVRAVLAWCSGCLHLNRREFLTFSVIKKGK